MDRGDRLTTRWSGWLERLAPEVVTLHHDRQIARALMAAIEQRGPAPDPFLAHYTRLYVGSQATRVRRVARADKSAISLSRLLRDMGRHPGAVGEPGNLDRADEGAAPDQRWGGAAARLRKLAGAGEGRIDGLLGRVGVVVGTADRLISGIGEHRMDEALAVVVVDDAVEEVGEVFRDTAEILRVPGQAVLPSMRDDWQRVFRAPLFEPT